MRIELLLKISVIILIGADIATGAVGTTDLNVSTMYSQSADPYISAPSTGAKAKVIENVPFDNDSVAKQKDINVSVAGNARPTVVKVCLKPVPWLSYTAVGAECDYYRVRFIGGGSWAGVGKTGNVVNSKSSSEENIQRMNW